MQTKHIYWCKNCLNTNTRPRITFDKRGWCNACQWMEEKKTLNWNKRTKELLNILKKYRSNNNKYDCVVPVSGGKDGSYIAYKLKNKYKMNPLCINVAPPLPLDIGTKNLDNFHKSGFDLVQLHLNYELMRHLDLQGFIKMGSPYWGWMTAIHTAVIRTACKLGLELIIYGEDGETEYGGSSETKNQSLISIEYQKRIWLEGGYKKIINQIPSKLKKYSEFWKYPDNKDLKKSKCYSTTMSYFEPWDSYRNYLISKKYMGLQENKETKGGTFTNFAQNDQKLYSLHTYLMYLKFGFGRATQDVGIEIRRGAMTRNQGLNIVKIYDNAAPENQVSLFCDYYKITKNKYYQTLDKWANKKLFKKVKDIWVPKFKVK